MLFKNVLPLTMMLTLTIATSSAAACTSFANSSYQAYITYLDVYNKYCATTTGSNQYCSTLKKDMPKKPSMSDVCTSYKLGTAYIGSDGLANEIETGCSTACQGSDKYTGTYTKTGPFKRESFNKDVLVYNLSCQCYV